MRRAPAADCAAAPSMGRETSTLGLMPIRASPWKRERDQGTHNVGVIVLNWRICTKPGVWNSGHL